MSTAEEILRQRIEEVHNTPWNLLFNNCTHKSIKIFGAAKELGIKAELISCLARLPCWGGIIILPHMFVMVDGEKVNVSLSPEQERKYFRNDQYKIYLPIRIACTGQ